MFDEFEEINWRWCRHNTIPLSHIGSYGVSPLPKGAKSRLVRPPLNPPLLTLYWASSSKKEKNRSPIVINWHNRVCIPQSRATCQPITAHYRQATHYKKYDVCSRKKTCRCRRNRISNRCRNRITEWNRIESQFANGRTSLFAKLTRVSYEHLETRGAVPAFRRASAANFDFLTAVERPATGYPPNATRASSIEFGLTRKTLASSAGFNTI